MTAVSIILASLCAVWFVQAAFVFAHLAELRTLALLDPSPPPAWPRVSAIVPARDEAAKLGPALASRLADGYPDLELIVVDDRSTDATPDIIASLAARDPRVRPIRVNELPDGWLGKVHALRVGVEAATGPWLLISDADITFEPGALRKAVAYCESAGVDFLALVPEFRSRSHLVDMAWALFVRVFSMLMSPRAVRDPRSKVAVGSGSFMLLRRSAYDATAGFEHLRLETADDMALGAMCKAAGARCDFMNGRGACSVSIYDSLGEFFRGVEKNGSSLAAAPFAQVAAVFLLLGCLEYSPLVALAVGLAAHVAWLAALGAVTTLLATAATVVAVHLDTGLVVPGLLWPAGWALMAAATLRSAWLVHRRGGVVWRGTFYAKADVLAAQRYRIG